MAIDPTKANFARVHSLVLEHLNISAKDSYGIQSPRTLDRFPKQFITDETRGADILLARMLAKNNNNPLQKTLWKTYPNDGTTYLIDGAVLPPHHNIVAVSIEKPAADGNAAYRTMARPSHHQILINYKRAWARLSPKQQLISICGRSITAL